VGGLLNFHEIWGIGILWTREELIKFCKLSGIYSGHFVILKYRYDVKRKCEFWKTSYCGGGSLFVSSFLYTVTLEPHMKTKNGVSVWSRLEAGFPDNVGKELADWSVAVEVIKIEDAKTLGEVFVVRGHMNYVVTRGPLRMRKCWLFSVSTEGSRCWPVIFRLTWMVK